MWNRNSLVFYSATILMVLTVLGCSSGGPEKATVTGTVTLDGTPVEGAGVVITPEAGGTPANATTDASGEFSTEALLGPSTVAVIKTKPIGGGSTEELEEGDSPEDMGEGTELEYLVPMKYGLASTSGLKADVAKGMEPLNLELKSQ